MFDPEYDSENICETCKYNFESSDGESWCTFKGARSAGDRGFDVNGVCIYCKDYSYAEDDYEEDDDEDDEYEEDYYDDEWD